jgi:hypothetical protein
MKKRKRRKEEGSQTQRKMVCVSKYEERERNSEESRKSIERETHSTHSTALHSSSSSLCSPQWSVGPMKDEGSRTRTPHPHP